MSKHTPGPWQAHQNGNITANEKDVDLVASAYCGAKIKDVACLANANLIAAAPELLDELKKANQIIFNALNIMRPQDKRKWGEANLRDGVDGEGITRANERLSLIDKAEGKFNKEGRD